MLFADHSHTKKKVLRTVRGAARTSRHSLFPQKKHKKGRLNAFLSHRGSRSRTRIDGFGDRFPTIRRFPFIRKKGSFASVLAFRCFTHPQNRIYLSYSSQRTSRLPPFFSFGQALVRLVAVSCIHYCTSTSALSTSSSSRGFTLAMG